MDNVGYLVVLRALPTVLPRPQFALFGRSVYFGYSRISILHRVWQEDTWKNRREECGLKEEIADDSVFLARRIKDESKEEAAVKPVCVSMIISTIKIPLLYQYLMLLIATDTYCWYIPSLK